jgi:hypothetical protein
MRSIAVSGILILAGIVLGHAPAEAEPLAAQVNRAIDRGVALIRTEQKDDGSFKTADQKNFPLGNTALHLYTLLKSGVPAKDPQVLKAIEYLRYRPIRRTYSAAALIMALDALDARDDREHKLWIQKSAAWLEETFGRKSGLWAYPGHHADLSNTQYGVLGLWVAERHGYRAKTEIWARLLESLLVGHQKEDGGFAYRRDRVQTGSMTTSGITVLTLALARVPEGKQRFKAARRAAKKALGRAWVYLDRRFTAEANPLGSFAFTNANHAYYLFGLERVAAITGRERIGGEDWYEAGARHLVATQDAKGAWASSRRTCFALLFLRRATFTTVDRPIGKIAGDGVPDAPPAPKRPGSDVPCIRRWLVMGPFENPDDGGLYREHIPEAKASPRPGASSGRRPWRIYRSSEDYVDLNRATEPGDDKLAYAFTYLRVREDVEAVLWMGHDDDCRVFLDGELIHDHHFHEWKDRDRVHQPVTLTAGTHRLLVKVGNQKKGHGFWARVARPDGKSVSGLLPSLVPDGSDKAETALAQPRFFTMDELLVTMPLDPRQTLTFTEESDVLHLGLTNPYRKETLWFDAAPEEKAKEGPSPGAKGILRLHPAGKSTPVRALRRVRLPKNATWFSARVCADAWVRRRGRSAADAVLRLGVYDGKFHWLVKQTIGPHKAPSPGNWVHVQGDLTPHAGKEAILIVEVANGGRTGWYAENMYFDEIAILTK